MSQRTLLLLSQDNSHYERLLKAAHLPHLHILRADNQAEAEQLIGDAHILMAEPARAKPLLAKAGKLLRVARGAYVAPVSSRFGARAPSVEKAVEALDEL
mgnify:CR=1 FL=1